MSGPALFGRSTPIASRVANGVMATDGQPALRIAIVAETFAKDMGYVSNTLPKYLARQGHLVDLVTSEKLPYFQKGTGDTTYGQDFALRNLNTIGSQRADGFTVHTLPSATTAGYPRLKGLHEKLADLKPDIVCIFVSAGWIPLDCARSARKLGFRLVIGNHTGKTHFALAQSGAGWASPPRIKNFVLRTVPGRYVGTIAHHCVVPTVDCVDIVSDYFGVQRNKVRVMNLPVDTDVFHPVASATESEERAAMRTSFGFDDSDVVCVYSGKFTHTKNPSVLLSALEILAAEGANVRGLFIGAGEQFDALASHPLARVVPFKPFSELGKHFRAGDIGVWMDESISYLDAASCGLPLVLGSMVKDVSHLHEFTAVYPANDPQGLAAALRPLLDIGRRRQIGEVAARLAGERFSADRYARQRVAYFREALQA